jgi:dCMP deaminase
MAQYSDNDPLHQNPVRASEKIEERVDQDEEPILLLPLRYPTEEEKKGWIPYEEMAEEIYLSPIEPTEAERASKDILQATIDAMEKDTRTSVSVFQKALEYHDKALRGELPEEKSPSPPRPSLIDTMFKVAHDFAERGTCPRKKVGCVIISEEGFVLATGYNGSPKGTKHCLEIGCVEDNYGHCSRSIHAEINAISQAALRGTSLRDSRIFVTLMPCLTCAKALIQSGVKEIYWEENYLENQRDAKLLTDLLEECGVLWSIRGA